MMCQHVNYRGVGPPLPTLELFLASPHLLPTSKLEISSLIWSSGSLDTEPLHHGKVIVLGGGGGSSRENRPHSMPSIHLAWNPKHVIVQWVGIGTHII